MSRAAAGSATVSVRHSIGTRLFAGFVGMSLITAALGAYGLFSLWQVGGIVADTYDRPLMAINYARSASFFFAEMDKEALRRRTASSAEAPAIDRRQQSLTGSFFEDLGVADRRSLSDGERAQIREIKGLVQRWTVLQETEPADVAAMDALSDRIGQEFDRLIELTADDSFLKRRQSVLTVRRFETVNVVVIGLTFILSAAITYYLSRRISRPLSAAAAIADRIGRGELQTPTPRPKGFPDETGVLLNSLTVMQERIREMMEREQAMRHSAQVRLADAVESSEEGMVLVDAEGRIVLANQRFSSLFPGIAALLDPSGELAGADPAAVLRRAADAADSVLQSGGEVALPDGRWIRVSRSPTREGGFFLFLGDVTEIKQREERYKAAMVAAEAANVAKSQFLANMSHELRTPLNAIIGFSDMFIGEYYGPLGSETYMQYAHEINGSGWRLLTVIQNVLDLSQSQAGGLVLRAEPHDLRQTVEEGRRPLAENCAEAGLELTVAMPDEPLMMQGDAEKLRRVLDNLTSNAVRFSRPGGSVRVEATGDESHIRLRVVDAGIGIPPDSLPLAISPFGQVDARLARRYEGTGLGLPIAKAFVELHGGEIALDSEPGRGTTVTLRFDRLPAAQQPA